MPTRRSTSTATRRSSRSSARDSASDDATCPDSRIYQYQDYDCANDTPDNAKPSVLAKSSRSEELRRGLADAQKYIENCAKYNLAVDPGVVISLRTEWHVLQPTTQFSEGSMLPLLDVLNHTNYIRHLKLASSAMQSNRSAGNGNTNARCLYFILKNNEYIETLDISDTGLDDDGLGEICEALVANSSITSLDLSSNHFGSLGAERLRLALERNTSVRSLNLSRNALGFHSINSLQCSCLPRGMTLQTNGNFVFEEILNAVSHGIAFLASIVAANILISEAAMPHRTDYHFWACVLYSFALMFLFLFSTLFHSFFMMPESTSM